MKILFLNRFFYPDHSATSQMLSDLAFFLSNYGHEVNVITSRLRYADPKDQLPAFEQINGVSVHRVWTSRFGRYFLPGRAFDYFTFYLSAAWRLWRLAENETIVIAKTDPPLISVVARFVVAIRKSQLVNWLQDLFPEVAIALRVRGFEGWFGRWLIKVRNYSLNHAEMNVVIGERMRDKLISEGVAPDKIQVIHNWADGKAIRPVRSEELGVMSKQEKSEGDTLRKEWGLERNFVVGYSGNLGRAHEFKTIIDAAGKLNKEKDNVFLFIGGGAQVELVKEEGRKRSLDNLMFKPYQPREMLNQSLGLPDVHLVALRPEMEGLIVPSKFYGIAAAGKPTLFVGDAEGEIANIINRHQMGVAIQTGDSDYLARTIQELKNDTEKTKALGEKAREVFEKNFDMDIALEKWEEVLKELSNEG
ncbi:MAG: colanic acid biosynthesis glycosyl transferase [Gammaproteobacteria bacterium SG8_11]|nr:MAG: colanic acid biosynthesis glycosyl transferase [Gammaproteobacteria bacterium SG8_11]